MIISANLPLTGCSIALAEAVADVVVTCDMTI